MSSFSDLPFELVEHILSYCRQAELYSLACTSRTLYTLAGPFLYSNVDLQIRPSYVPRIDTFFFNIATNTGRAKQVTSLRVGLSPLEGVKDGPRSLPGLPDAQKEKLRQIANRLISSEEWTLRYDSLLQDNLEVGYYGSFATLIVCALPSLRRLEISDHENSTVGPLLKVLRAASHDPILDSPLYTRLSSIEEISYSIDSDTGAQYSNDFSVVDLSTGFSLPGVRKIEFFIPHRNTGRLFGPRSRARNLITPLSATANNNITSVTILRTTCISQMLRDLLLRTPQIVSLTCDMWYDHRRTPPDNPVNVESPWINLGKWTDDLKLVKSTLQKLVLSVEYCDMTSAFYQQPAAREQFMGYLDLTELGRLHYLEVPVPFITGDPNFSIATTYSPCLPPNIRHLCLRTDMSQAQFAFPLDRSQELSFGESYKKKSYENGARMDLSYIFQASQFLLDSTLHLESISVWQPADLSLSWFEGQVIDLATACENKSVMGKMMYPQMFRLKNKEHWNLVKEVTLFDPATPERGRSEQFLRGERSCGIPLGLATQYHLRKFKEGQVQTDM